MKFAALAVVTAAVAGVGAVPVESGPLSHLQNRAAEAIGGVVGFIRREEAGHPAAPAQLKRSPVRFHNARDAEYLQRRNIAPLSTGGEKRGALPDLTRRDAPQQSVPPLAPFSTGATAEEVE